MPTEPNADILASRKRANDVLTPYVPRLVDRLAAGDPDALHREVDGSMVFVDISGFTALSERLARRGKIGAELMRDTLNDVFIALLDEAYDYGAGLLKWGGDALLLLFDGPGHEERACRAAWEMQRTLDRVGRLKAGGGTVTLRMSVGITTRDVPVLPRRERPPRAPDRRARRRPRRSRWRRSPTPARSRSARALAARLDPACVGPAEGRSPAARRRRRMSARERAPDVGDVERNRHPFVHPDRGARTRPARAERARAPDDHGRVHRPDGHRRAARASSAPTRSPRRSTSGSARSRRRRSHYEVPFYETDVGKGSVKALLTAGAPSSTGHDEERMLRALREIMEQPGVVPMRIGVNTGKVFTGDFGPPYRRAVPRLRRRDQHRRACDEQGRAGQILATEVVLERSRTTFETTPIEPFAAKGKSEPVRASIVGPVTGTKEARRAGDAARSGGSASSRPLLAASSTTRAAARAGSSRSRAAPGLGKSTARARR